MKKAICFGAADGGKRLIGDIRKEFEILAFTDNDQKKIGGEIDNIKIMALEECLKLDYDYIVITSQPGLQSITEQLVNAGIDSSIIIDKYVTFELQARREFLLSFSRYDDEFPVDGECAEAGVFQGDFAKEINGVFPKRTLHLFDTFEGFDEKDIAKEKHYSKAKVSDYNNTSEKCVMDKMPYPEKVIIHKGFFPETAKGLDSRFVFVNLDLDLYEPTYQGLKFFEDKMLPNGVILVHDYFSRNFTGPKDAVEFYLRETKKELYRFPIGDRLSIMICGY